MRSFFVLILLAVLVHAVGCGGSSSPSTTSTSGSSSGSSSGSNVLAISVDGGPTANYPNAAFASATICAPGSTTNCVTVNNLLVDTGSIGIRVLQSAMGSLSLPAVDASNDSAAYDCVAFVDGSYMWGPVQQADVTLGGETASNLPIHVVSSSNTGIPSSCSNGSTVNANTVENLGANGILGVGSEPTDCFFEGANFCAPGSGSSPPSGVYYTCSGATCNPAFIGAADQVANPAVLFPTDNNGAIVELPAVSGSAATITGSLVFGIGTEQNNQLPSSATVFTLTCDFFTTEFENNTYGVNSACTGPASFIDSGSSALYFPNAANIPLCPASTPAGDLSSWYCPSSPESFSATNLGANGTQKATSFSVANAEDLFTSPSTDADNALSQLGGLNPTGFGFDWGLPFFYGNNVYVSIDGQKTPSGAPAAPWWAY